MERISNTSHLLSSAVDIRRRIEDKRDLLAAWMRDEGFVDYLVAARVLGTTPRTALRTLAAGERDELFRRIKAGGASVWILTNRGVLLHDPDLGHTDGRIAETTIRHARARQLARLAAVAAGWTCWRSERAIRREARADLEAKRPSRWPKEPDAVATSPHGIVTAIEVERTIKTSKRYAEIISIFLQMRRSGAIGEVHYLAESQRLADRLSGLFKSITSVRVKGTAVPLKPEHYDVFKFFCLDAWPP